MAESTWEQRERPILEAIAAMEEEDRSADCAPIAETTGLDHRTVARSMRKLIEGRYITALDAGTMGGPDYLGAELIERGLREVGAWPATVTEAFLGRLDAAIAEAEPEEVEPLETVRAGAVSVPAQKMANILGAATAGFLGL